MLFLFPTGIFSRKHILIYSSQNTYIYMSQKRLDETSGDHLGRFTSELDHVAHSIFKSGLENLFPLFNCLHHHFFSSYVVSISLASTCDCYLFCCACLRRLWFYLFNNCHSRLLSFKYIHMYACLMIERVEQKPFMEVIQTIMSMEKLLHFHSLPDHLPFLAQFFKKPSVFFAMKWADQTSDKILNSSGIQRQ